MTNTSLLTKLTLVAVGITSSMAFAASAEARDCKRFPSSCYIAVQPKVPGKGPCLQCGIKKIDKSVLVNPAIKSATPQRQNIRQNVR
jgi:hypothetical protein